MTKSVWQPAYIALGSNLKQPAEQVCSALAELHRLTGVSSVIGSSLYRSAPLGPQDQPEYVNAVAGLLTQLAPEALLTELHQIEQRMGRVRAVRWGPRIIDLDLLLMGELHIDSEVLVLPHPGLLQRNFVMVPLAEIAPALVLPNGKSAASMALALGDHGLERLP